VMRYGVSMGYVQCVDQASGVFNYQSLLMCSNWKQRGVDLLAWSC
jgi:hypothetical protein